MDRGGTERKLPEQVEAAEARTVKTANAEVGTADLPNMITVNVLNAIAVRKCVLNKPSQSGSLCLPELPTETGESKRNLSINEYI